MLLTIITSIEPAHLSEICIEGFVTEVSSRVVSHTGAVELVAEG